jgi:hypothetical protein
MPSAILVALWTLLALCLGSGARHDAGSRTRVGGDAVTAAEAMRVHLRLRDDGTVRMRAPAEARARMEGIAVRAAA